MDRKTHTVFCQKRAVAKHATSTDTQVVQRINQKGMGVVFTPADFLDLGSRNAIDLALGRAVRAGAIRKLARGLYDTPRVGWDGHGPHVTHKHVFLAGEHRLGARGRHAARGSGERDARYATWE